MGDFGSVAPDFTKKELACRCCGVCKMDGDFLFALQALRNAMGEPVHVNSAYRCPEHNREVGGVVDSQHLYGRAADVLVRDSAHAYKVLSAAIRGGFKGIGIAENFIHLDERPLGRAVWIYPKTVTAEKKR